MQTNLYRLLVILFITIQVVLSSHFRGAVIMVRPKPGGRLYEMEISFHISWRRDSGQGGMCNSTTVNLGTLFSGRSLTCHYGCSGIISSQKYFCTEFSSNENWSFGSNVITYDFSTYSGGLITIGILRTEWIQPFSSYLNVSTTFNLTPRSDTGQINSSPRAVSLPLQLQSGCHHTIPMAVSDPDGDVVRCRWAVGKECGGVCNAIPGAVLNSATCSITYLANRGTGYKAVAVMVEDFISGSSQPLSSVAFQFLVSVVSSSQSCSRKPKFIAPTPSSGSHITISLGGTFTTQLRADSGYYSYSVTDIQIAGPIGLIKGGLRRISTTNDYYVTITWTPQANQTGTTHHFCFIAINSRGVGSVQSCIFLVCASSATLIPIPFPEKLLVSLHNVSLPIKFNTAVQQSYIKTCISDITFLESNSNKAVYRINSSATLSEISYDKPQQITIRPKYIFTDGSTYYIKFVLNCAPYQLRDKSLWKFVITDPTPLIVSHPTNTSAAAPFSGVFTCSARGYGAPLVVEWKRENSDLPSSSNSSTQVLSSGITTSTLVIPNVTNDDVGSYYCIVWNKKKGAQSSSANLSFSGKPIQPSVVVLAQQIYLTTNNYNLSLQCTPYSSTLRYLWQRQNSNLPSRAHGVNSAFMTITNLKPEDSGEYRCTVSNSTGSIASDYAKIIIQVSPPKIIKQPNRANVQYYSTVTFTCTVEAFGYTTVVWRKVGSILPISATVKNTPSLNEVSSILTITGVAGYYGGFYYCIAMNQAGSTLSNNAELIVQVPLPEILRPLRNVTVRFQQTVRLYCLALSRGALIYDWKRLDGNQLSSASTKSYIHKKYSDTNQVTITYELKIHKVKLSDEGWYCCMATNDGGYTEKCIWLEVDTTPTITQSPKSTTVRAGSENITPLWCSATGMGPIHYQWEKYQPSDGSWIKPSNRVVNITSHKLTFGEIREEDEGVYHCIVTNDDGSVVSDNATITVYGPPTITSVSSDTTLVEGSKVSLMCNATNDVDALNEVKIVWLRKISKDLKEEITTGGNILMYNRTDSSTDKTHSVLLFDPVNHTDDGEYICRAFNHPQSYSEGNITLKVKYPPILTFVPGDSPDHVNVNQHVEVSCIAKGLPLPTVQWFSNGIAVSSIGQPQVSVTVQTSYPHTAVYTCVGINKINKMEHKINASITVIVGQTCPTLANPANGRVIVVGQSAFYVCNTGFTVVGNPFNTCVGGKWISPPAMCK